MELEKVYRTKSESSSRIIVIEALTELHGFGIVGDDAATMAHRNDFVEHWSKAPCVTPML